MKRIRFALLALVLLTVAPIVSLAHVKWFAEPWSFADQPTPISQLITPITIGLLLFTMFALALAVFIDVRLQAITWYTQIMAWFEARKNYAPLVLRIGLGMTLMLAWQDDKLLSPDLDISRTEIGWLEFVLALLLIFPRTTPLAGVGVLALYGVGILEHGAFYMLDYFIFVGVAIYLIVANVTNPRVRALRIPALYFSVGFSLFWVAIEKLVYPQWGLAILADREFLTLGLDPLFFLTAAAFVELALGYLFIIGLLERPMAIVVTLVFFTTSLVFGKVEVIGHTIIHAALIVFLLEGTKNRLYPAPIAWNERTTTRMAFSAVNFVIVLVALSIPYLLMATSAYSNSAGVVFMPLMRVLWGV